MKLLMAMTFVLSALGALSGRMLLLDCGDQRIRVNGLEQDGVRSRRQSLLHYLAGPGHHNYWSHPKVVQRPDQSDKLQSVSSMHSVAHQNHIVRLFFRQPLERASAIVADDNVPTTSLEHLREQSRNDLGALYD